MRDKLFLYLNVKQETPVSWVITRAGEVLESVYLGSVEMLKSSAAEKEIIVLVPPEDVILAMTELPKMSQARLRQALPFALEEQLIADLETLHFAVGKRQTTSELPVAIVAREKIQTWLALLKSWQIVPDSLLPLSLGLPLEENGWHIAVYDEVAVIRLGLMQVITAEAVHLSSWLASLEISTPSFIEIHNYSGQSLMPALTMDCDRHEEMDAPKQLLIDAAKQLQAEPPINLLQGDFAIKKSKFPRMKKIEKVIKYAAIVWMALLFLYPTVSYFILQAHLGKIDDQIAEIYHRQFPQSKLVIAPKLRMQEKLQKRAAQQGRSHLFVWLADVGKGLADSNGVSLKRIDFQNGLLTMELTAVSTEALTHFTDYLTQQGLSVKQQSASLTGSRMTASMVIE